VSAAKEPLQGLRRHKLLPAEIRDHIPALYSQDGKGKDATVYLKLFCPYNGRMTLYVTEASAIIDGDDGTVQQDISLADAFNPGNGYIGINGERIKDIRFFGYMISPQGPDCDEFGYSSFNELANVTVFGRVPAIERDCSFEVGKLTVAECLEKHA
jgi:hypothetical protein